jgi:hypothetical protein
LWGGRAFSKKDRYKYEDKEMSGKVEIRRVMIGGHSWDVPMYLPEIRELPEGEDEMSVIASQRGIAKMEFFHRARVIRRDITNLTRIDFGIHSGNRPPVFNRELTDYDKILLEEFGRNLRNSARELVYNIVKANSIYPHLEVERDSRRLLQDTAIGCCEIMYQEFSYCVDTFHVRPSVFQPLVDKINIEIELLKAWRKQTNQMFKGVK